MSTQTAPFQRITWPASGLATFGGYRAYRRLSRAQAQTWRLLLDQSQLLNVNGAGTIGGYPALNVQTNHREFRDYDAAWSLAGGLAADGYDYAITALDGTGLESLVGVALGVMGKNVADVQPWAVNNSAPFLNFPLASVSLQSSGADRMESYPIAGRDFAMTRAPLELPERKLTIQAEFFGRTGEYQLTTWEAAAASGLAMTVLTPRGDRYLGGLAHPTTRAHGQVGVIDATGVLVETSRDPITASDINIPCGAILNGTSQYVTVPDNALLQPGSGPWSLMIVGTFTWSASKGIIVKGNITAGAAGFGIQTGGSANQIQIRAIGSGSLNATITNATIFDGNVHALVLTFDGTNLVCYLDDSTTPIGSTSGAPGSVNTATALTIGATNGGSGFCAMTPNVAGYWNRALSSAEAVASSQAARGYSGARMAASAGVLLDLRDDRTWKGYGTTLVDLSAIPPVLNGTLVGTPPTIGRPWTLSLLERVAA